MLKPSAYRRSVVLPNMQRAIDLIWPTPSDDRPTHGVQAWGAVRVSWSPVLRQMVPTVMRLYTRKTGERREVMGSSVTLTKLAHPAGGPEDKVSESAVLEAVQATLPALIDVDTVIARIFPEADVLLPHHQ